MELVPLSSDGRVTVVDTTMPASGPLRVALQPDGGGVGIVALGSGIARPLGRLDAADATAYAPVLRALRTQGRIGTCAAEAGPDGSLVLDLAPAAECVFANSPGDLVMLAAEHTVTVTREEHHQDVLFGRGGRVAVELSPCTVAAGQDGIEVRLDGRRVGELTRLTAQRYLPVVEEILAGGRRAGCEARLGRDHRGMQMELRLPAVDTTVAAPVEPVSDGGLPDAATSVGPVDLPPDIADSGDLGDSDGGDPAPTVGVPGPRVAPASATVVPSVAPSPATRRRRRPVVWAGAATVGVVVLAAAVGAGAKPGAPPAGTTFVVRPATASPASPTSVVPTDASTTTTASPGTTRARAAAAGAVVPSDTRGLTTRVVPRRTTPTRAPSTTRVRPTDASTSTPRDGGSRRGH